LGDRVLASASHDGAVHLWDVAGGKDERPRTLTASETERLWADLAGADAAKAYRAVCTLGAVPEASLPLLREHLRPPPPPAPVDTRKLARLLTDLDDNTFRVRQQASREL